MGCTSIKVCKDKVIVCRFIHKLYRIEFNLNVKAKDIAEYFNISDDKFKQLVR